MLGKTHIVIGITATLILFSQQIFNNPKMLVPFLSISVVAAILPDSDKETSMISNKLRKLTVNLSVVTGVIIYISYKTKAFKGIDINSLINKISISPGIETGLILFLILIVFSKFSPHRSFTHSLLGIFLYSISMFLIYSSLVPVFIFNYGLHLLADFFADKGIELFYPYKKRVGISLLNTNSISEYVLRYVILLFGVLQLYYPLTKLFIK